MLNLILRTILFFLIAQTLFRVVRAVSGARGRETFPPTPPPGSRPGEIDPRDIVEATYREVEDDRRR